MTKHVIEWLAAFHDGELGPARRRRVEDHLKECASCRAELEALEGLSSLLRANPLPEGRPAARFAAQVMLRVPRRPAREGGLPRGMLGAPLALILAWAFAQAGLGLTSLVLAADGLFIPGRIGESGWLGTAGGLLLIDLALTAVTAILMTGWLAFWWAWKRNLDFELESQSKGVVI